MSGYAVRLDGQGARAVDGPNPNPEKPDWVFPDYSFEYWWPDTDGPPPQPVPLPPTREQLVALARLERDRLLVYATLRIDPLQYAVDVDEASEEDIALLKLWKKYSVAVSKTETKPGWPETPQWPVPPVPLEVNNSETETLE